MGVAQPERATRCSGVPTRAQRFPICTEYPPASVLHVLTPFSLFNSTVGFDWLESQNFSHCRCEKGRKDAGGKWPCPRRCSRKGAYFFFFFAVFFAKTLTSFRTTGSRY